MMSKLGKCNGPPGWAHEVGSLEYFTTDGRGKVLCVRKGFATSYEAYVDDKLIGTKPQRGQAFRLVEQSKS